MRAGRRRPPASTPWEPPLGAWGTVRHSCRGRAQCCRARPPRTHAMCCAQRSDKDSSLSVPSGFKRDDQSTPRLLVVHHASRTHQLVQNRCLVSGIAVSISECGRRLPWQIMYHQPCRLRGDVSGFVANVTASSWLQRTLASWFYCLFLFRARALVWYEIPV